ncbi:MAG TPA: hypothetical protein DHW78_08415 [Ruminococcaceae bacterium]|nr:hypothetical protein [Oscillospiraceae bacterium]
MHNYTKFCFTYFFTSTPSAHIPKLVGWIYSNIFAGIYSRNGTYYSKETGYMKSYGLFVFSSLFTAHQIEKGTMPLFLKSLWNP